MRAFRAGLVAAGLLFSANLSSFAMAQAPIVTDVAFPKGASSTTISGSIKGYETRDYVVRASAGQTMKVDMTGASILYFNVLPPGSNDVAIFVGSTSGNNFAGTLSQSGAYKIRVYQMRASARRNESGSFKLAVAVTGKASGSTTAGSSGSPAKPGGLAGLNGMSSIAAIDAMSERGFANVDSFESGTTQYGIFYNRSTKVCAQLTMADGKVEDARDIKTHPKCR